jgi:predicted MPP superfamily phosphohydrolase
MRLAWATDIHLNFLTSMDRRRFLESVKGQADAMVVTGDIAESNSLGEILRQMMAVLDMPIHFVLGNHDFYRGSVVGTRLATAEMISGSEYLVYLSQTGVVELTPSTALVGHDGWADARLGGFDGSDVILNDFLLIDELRCWRDQHTLDKPALRQALQALGDEAAAYLKGILSAAADKYPRVIVATHVPPFRETTWHQGRPSADDYLPYFSCKAMGDVLLEAAGAYPQCDLLVLCGHTHGGGEVQVLENLRVLTGPAEYGKPVIQQIIEVA